MGIRNIVDADQARTVPPLTTPHGDQEPLPRLRVSILIGLTTPHGDQELQRHPSRVDAHPVLTTPHGDQEHSFVAALSGQDLTSLPLMGIRNAAHLRRRKAAAASHYPSWGSGTCTIGALSLRCSPAHYPLMGIRNQRCRAGRRAVYRPHYPSWGSGTPIAGPITSRLSSLTTPHGDQEHREQRIVRRRYARSLPLMGIRNVDNAAPDRLDAYLTTPHGDQEQRSGIAIDMVNYRSHYPSWGSGTSVPTPCVPTATAHYPSWGSGTRRSLPACQRRARPHYPSWGSGTVPRSIAAR